MKKHNKRWLISRLKTSGSKRRFLENGKYSEERNSKKSEDLEYLPQKESIKKTHHVYNGKINYGLLVRFLRGQVGNNWDDVYSEIISRIPTKLLDFKDIVFWFVADKVELVDGKPYNKQDNLFVWTPEQGEDNVDCDFREFYVDPTTNQLMRVQDKASNRKTRQLETSELREFREKEKSEKLNEKRLKKTRQDNDLITAKSRISEDNKRRKGKH